MDISVLKNLREDINNLDEYGYHEILKIINNNSEKYTENKNGIFVNLNKLNETTIKQIKDYLIFNKNTKLI